MSEEEGKASAEPPARRLTGLLSGLLGRAKSDPRILLIGSTLLLSCIILVAVPSTPPQNAGKSEEKETPGESPIFEGTGISLSSLEKLGDVQDGEAENPRRRVQPIQDLAMQQERSGMKRLAADTRRIGDVMMRAVQAQLQAERLFEAGHYRAARALYYLYLSGVDERLLLEESTQVALAALRIGQCYYRESTSHESCASLPADIDLHVGPIRDSMRDFLSIERSAEGGDLYRMVAYGMPADQLFKRIEARGPGYPVILPDVFPSKRISAVMKETPLEQAIEKLAGIFSHTTEITMLNGAIEQIQLRPEPTNENLAGREQLCKLGLKALTRALTRYPSSEDKGIAYLTSGLIWEELEEPERAIEEYLALIESAEGGAQIPAGLLRLGILHEEMQRWDMARSYYDRLVKTYPKAPESPEALYRCGTILLDQQNLRDARTYLAVLLNDVPDSQFARAAKVGFLEASILLELESPSPSLPRSILAKLAELAHLATDPLTRPRYLRLSTKVLLRLNEREGAVREALAAANEYKDNPQAARNLLLTAANIALEQDDFLGAYFTILSAPPVKEGHELDPAAQDLDTLLVRSLNALNLPERIPMRVWKGKHVPAQMVLEAATELAKQLNDTTKLQLLLEREDTAGEAVLALASHELDRGGHQQVIARLEDFLGQELPESIARRGFELLGDAYSDLEQYDLAASAYLGSLAKEGEDR